MNSVSVRFVEVRGVVAVLSVDAQPGFVSLETICSVLFSLRVQVMHATEQGEGGRLRRRIAVCDFAGGPLRARRRHEIEATLRRVLNADRFEPVRPIVRTLPSPPPPPDRVASPEPPKPSPPSRRAA
jgi:hypothetical protein